MIIRGAPHDAPTRFRVTTALQSLHPAQRSKGQQCLCNKYSNMQPDTRYDATANANVIMLTSSLFLHSSLQGSGAAATASCPLLAAFGASAHAAFSSRVVPADAVASYKALPERSAASGACVVG